jgi:hypothetical protein
LFMAPLFMRIHIHPFITRPPVIMQVRQSHGGLVLQWVHFGEVEATTAGDGAPVGAAAI